MVRWQDLSILGWMMGGWVWMEGWVFAFDIIQPVHICYASLMHVLFLEWVRLRWWLQHLKISGSGILAALPSPVSALCASDQKFSHRRVQPKIIVAMKI